MKEEIEGLFLEVISGNTSRTMGISSLTTIITITGKDMLLTCKLGGHRTKKTKICHLQLRARTSSP